MNYMEINRNVYNQLATEYDRRTHKINDNFRRNIYKEINMEKFKEK